MKDMPLSAAPVADIGISYVAFQSLLALALSVLGCSAALLAAFSKNVQGAYDYSTSVIPMISEFLKLIISLFLQCMGPASPGGMWHGASPTLCAQYTALGLLYAVQNYTVFLAIGQMDPATFQVLGNLKIPVTAALLHMITGRLFDTREIISLGALVVGAVLSQVTDTYDLEVSFRGLTYILLISTLSGTGGVANQVLLKEGRGSMHMQNTLMYSSGLIFSILNVARVLHTDEYGKSPLNPFEGFNACAWLSIVNLAVLGLATSAILRYGGCYYSLDCQRCVCVTHSPHILFSAGKENIEVFFFGCFNHMHGCLLLPA